ncbi:chloride channel protein [Cyanobium sp. HWJ4-Hawea]|uniref:chloride channel protein n=1 Tax=Cyanobium sp. HWJ4-Hawea TaxID=2823713 RepID=UPI0020CB92E3|nr:chloride channel protein [Cyanobium sp. HWJ4-Hawea]MCP9809947.1 chloride channel protein [Cyanobium sp. HWJ4-Hawea]
MPPSPAFPGGSASPDSPASKGPLITLLQLLALGALVGLACLPLNLVDGWQAAMLHRLPGFTNQSWELPTLLMAVAPVAVMPALLWLQAGPMRRGAGSGIPQTIECLENPSSTDELMGSKPLIQRLSLWTAASLALMPLGREGPVVQVGAAVAVALRKRFPRLLAGLPDGSLLAIGAGAGLAGGFNSPLMGAVFVFEELTGRFQAKVLCASALVCAVAALISNLTGIPIFILSTIQTPEPEVLQLLFALPVGLVAGALGGLFAKLLLKSTAWLRPQVLRQPLRWGLILGAALALIAVVSGGRSGGDGEALMGLLLSDSGPIPVPGSPLDIFGWLLLLAARIVAPILALAAGIPGGVIDPAFAIGSVFGSGSFELLGGNAQLGLALGMAGALAGATQLPLITILFSLRMLGDQQWLFGLLISAFVGASVGRKLQPEAIYHALWGLGRSPLAEKKP